MNIIPFPPTRKAQTTTANVGEVLIAPNSNAGGTSATPVVVSSGTLVTTGKPIDIRLVPLKDNSTSTQLGIFSAAGSQGNGNITFFIDGTQVAQFFYGNQTAGTTGNGGNINLNFPGYPHAVIDGIAAGSHTIQAKYQSNGVMTFNLGQVKLFAMEMM